MKSKNDKDNKKPLEELEKIEDSPKDYEVKDFCTSTIINPIEEEPSIYESYKDVHYAIKKILKKLEPSKARYLSTIENKQNLIKSFLEEKRSINPGEKINFLYILKQWNSFTPILPSEDIEKTRKGGGYFLYCNGYGLVIDPGFNFIQNFLMEGFKLDDIDGILISHAHNDHSVELESICSLLYKKNNQKEAKQPRKQIDLFLNLGSFKKYAALFDLGNKNSSSYIKKIILLNKHQIYTITEDFSFFTTATKHHEIITEDYGLGFLFNCNNKLIRFTSDTGWDTKLEKNNFDELNKIGGQYDSDNVLILLAHIGSIKNHEFQYNGNSDFEVNENKKGKKVVFYQSHLGLLGCICMIKKWKPTLTIISEFGEELDDLRIDLTNLLGQAMGMQIIPGDIGLIVDIDNEKCFCQRTGCFSAIEDIKPDLTDKCIVYYSERSLDSVDKSIRTKIVEDIKNGKKNFIQDYLKKTV